MAYVLHFVQSTMTKTAKFLMTAYVLSLIFFCFDLLPFDFGPGPVIREPWAWIESEGRYARCGTAVAMTEMACCQILACFVAGFWEAVATLRKRMRQTAGRNTLPKS